MLADGWRLLRPHVAGLSALAVVVLLSLEILLAAVEERRGVDSFESWTVIAAICAAMALLTGFGVSRLSGRSWREAAAETAQHSAALVAVTLIATVGILLGLVLLVLPGVVLATWWMVVFQCLMLEDVRVRRAFARSRELVRGRFPLAFGALVVTVAACVLPLALALLSDEQAIDVAANTLADLISTLAFLAVSTSLYRLLAETDEF